MQTALDGPSSPIAGSIGALDHEGQLHASIAVPAGLNSSLAGLTLHHAYVLIDPSVPALVASSEADALRLLPWREAAARRLAQPPVSQSGAAMGAEGRPQDRSRLRWQAAVAGAAARSALNEERAMESIDSTARSSFPAR